MLLVWFPDTIIGNVRKQYIDTRTQANLSKLNANNRNQHLDIVTENLTDILVRRRNSGESSLAYLSIGEIHLQITIS